MGKVPGILTVRAHMWKRTNGLDNVPAPIRGYAIRNHPEYLDVPKLWDDTPNPTSWELYKSTHKPAE